MAEFLAIAFVVLAVLTPIVCFFVLWARGW